MKETHYCFLGPPGFMVVSCHNAHRFGTKQSLVILCGCRDQKEVDVRVFSTRS